MTDKIKSAQEWHKDGTLLYTLKQAGWEKGIEQFQNATTIKVDGDNAEAVAETILKALSAYEKLQEVDLDTVKEIEERWGNRFLELEEPVPEGMKRRGYVVDIHFLLTQLKSARLVADIGGK